MSTSIVYNGKLMQANKLVIAANNRSFRYGDGCFETMKLLHQKLILRQLHFNRLFHTLAVLQFEIPNFLTADYLEKQIVELAKKNNLHQAARIRLTFFRGNGGLYDAENHFPNYIIETLPLQEANQQLNNNGLDIDFFMDGRKSTDVYSNLKSNNYLLYAMAALWAKKNFLNDAIVLNNNLNLADTTIANIWIIQQNQIKTPALAEGCVAGVMRTYLLENLLEHQYAVTETSLSVEDVLQAEEVFVTNAIYGLRWVKQCKNSTYTNTVSSQLYKQFIQPLWL